MRKALWIITTLFVAIAAAPVTRADITYDVNLTVDTTSAITGTITTDGIITNNSFAASDILGWDLTVSAGPSSAYDFTSLCTSSCDILANDLSDVITTTSTEFDFSFADSVDGAVLELVTVPTWVGFADADVFPSNGEIYTNANGDNMNNTDPGNNTIGAVTPEPATAVLWLAGIGLMILMRKRLAHLLRMDTNSASCTPLSACRSAVPAEVLICWLSDLVQSWSLEIPSP